MAESHNKRHGRKEHRRVETSTRLAATLDWPGVQQVCRIIRTTTRDGQQSVEVQYAITSVPRSLGSAADILEWWRGHWGIENCLHWVRDVVFGEDACRVRTGSAPQILAAFRNAAITFMRSLGVVEITRALRKNACQVEALLTKLGIPKL